MKNVFDWSCLCHLLAGACVLGVGVGRSQPPLPKAEPGDARLSQMDVVDPVTPQSVTNDVYRIFFIGNSITRHGTTPNIVARLGWRHVSGMAASSEENDYAHRLAFMIDAHFPDKTPEIHFHNKGSGSVLNRLRPLEEFASLQPDLVVVQLGEHEREPTGVDALRDNYTELLRALQSWSPRPMILCTGVWSPSGAGRQTAYVGWSRKVEDTLRTVCSDLDIPFASVEAYALDPRCSGWGESPGVRWHPNDLGMQRYAEALFRLFLQQRPPRAHANLTIDLQAPRHPIPRRILGHNLEAGDTFGIFRDTHNYEPGQTGRGLFDPKTGTYEPNVVALTRQMGASVLRYPGGCITHNFDWKETIGPAAQRPNYTFGINEYLGFCKAVGAEPLITVTTYAGTPQDAADLVEYLNAPAEPRFPWAMRRAQDGFPDPYGVVLFEIGNESDHGNHNLKPFRRHTPEAYAAFFNACAHAMKAIDPGIKVGAHLSTSRPAGTPWDRIVLASARDTADFIAIHTYYVGVVWRDQQDGGRLADTPRIMQACMASAAQAWQRVADYRDLIQSITGRDIPIAVTEYNAAFTNHRPIPYRFTFGAALFSVDFLRILLDPALNVFMANYWQYHEGFWGALRRDGERNEDGTQNYKKGPAFDLFRLFADGLGVERVPISIESPTREFPGYGRTHPSLANRQHDRPAEWVDVREQGTAEGLSWRWSNHSLVLNLDACAKDQYPVVGYVDTDEPAVYRLRFEARYTGAPTDRAVLGIGLADARGWDQVRSACAAEGIEATAEWTSFTTEILPLHDCRRLALTLRVRNAVDDPLTGVLEARHIHVEKAAAWPPYPVLTGLASLSEKQDQLHLIVFNKDHEDDHAATIQCAGGQFTAVRAAVVRTDDLAFTNLQGDDAHAVVESTVGVLQESDRIQWVFPARSMTVLTFDRTP